MADEDLLRPTLSSNRAAPALYNSSGFFLSAFFAGPAAAGAYGLANSHRLGRLRQDLPVILALVGACYALLWLASREGWLERLTELLDDRPARAAQIASRALALACFAAIYLMHRRQYRAAEVSGVTALPGWVPGIAAVLVGLAANALFAMAIRSPA